MMKKILIIIFFSFFIQFSFGYEYIENINGYEGKVFKIYKDSPYKVVASISDDGESLKSLVEKVGGVAGINGVYFCPKDYSQCGGMNSSNYDRISNGKVSSKYNNTGIRYIFGFDINNSPLIYTSSGYKQKEFVGIYNGLSNFPLILKEGKPFLYSYKNHIDKKMMTKGSKSFICSTENEDIYMGYLKNMTLYTMEKALKKIGCYNALNLDAGWSLSVYDKGKYKVGPGRDIMDGFVIVENKKIINNLNSKSIKITKKISDFISNNKSPKIVKKIIIIKLRGFLERSISINKKYIIRNIIKNIENKDFSIKINFSKKYKQYYNTFKK